MVDDIKASFKELVAESQWMGKYIQVPAFNFLLLVTKFLMFVSTLNHLN